MCFHQMRYYLTHALSSLIRNVYKMYRDDVLLKLLLKLQSKSKAG